MKPCCRHLPPRCRLAAWGLVLALAGPASQAQPAAASAPAASWPLFAVQIRTGPRWEPQKPPQDQAHFQAHSAHLKRLREAGQLLMGARYADVGLLVLAAPDEAQARATMAADPSMQAEVFRFELHPLWVFYPGLVPSRGRVDPNP